MFISVFNYLFLKDCHPPELQWCWNQSRLVKLLVFCLLGKTFGQSFFVHVSFVSFYKQAKSVRQQMRNCVCKTQTATTGTRPPLVASQYSLIEKLRTNVTNLHNTFFTFLPFYCPRDDSRGGGGVLCLTPVRPSVCPSVRPSVSFKKFA